MDGRGLERAIKLPENMFEYFFDANSPCAGLVSATDSCPCTGLPPLVLFGKRAQARAVFAKDTRTERENEFSLVSTKGIRLVK